jgi:hypothetical protein
VRETVIKALPERNSHGGFLKARSRSISMPGPTYPDGVTTATVASKKDGTLEFPFPHSRAACYPLREQCTTSTDAHIGRRVKVGPHEELLIAGAQQWTDEFNTIYNGKRPTVERVIYRVVR